MGYKFLFVVFSSFLFGCASAHMGTMAESQDPDVVVSVERNPDLSDKYYLFYEYTIENKSSQWKDVQVVNVTFENEKSEILTGASLSAWIEGAELKLKAAEYNSQMLLASIVAVGGIVGVSATDPNVKVAGLGAMATGAALGTAQGVGRAQGKATSGKRGIGGTVDVPQTHIFVPSKVAPESYIRRWVVLRAPAQQPVKKAARPGKLYHMNTLISQMAINGAKPIAFKAEVESSLISISK